MLNAREEINAETPSESKLSREKIIGIVIGIVVVNIVFIFGNVFTEVNLSNLISSNGNERLPPFPSKVFIKENTTKMNSFSKKMKNETYDVRLKAPFTSVIAGPTGSGKTRLIQRLIENNETVTNFPPKEIVYCYGAWQNEFEHMKGVNFYEGIVNFEDYFPSDGEHRWLVIDDLMNELSSSKEDRNVTEKVFSKHSHHRNVSVFFISQNFFNAGFRNITLNAHYLFLFKNPRDSSQILHLGRQIFPSRPSFLQQSYNDATKAPYSFLFIDLKQNTDDDMRVLGNYFSEDESKPIISYSFQ